VNGAGELKRPRGWPNWWPRWEAQPEPAPAARALAPVLALVVTVLIGMGLFAVLGKPALQVIEVFFVAPLSSVRGVSEVLLKATPLVLCGVGLALCFRANVWNIGAEGQLIAGAIAGGGVALLATRDSGAMWIAVLVASALGGMLWAALTAVLRDRFNANEILVSLMLVYVAQLLLSWVVHGPWKDPQGFNFPQSALFERAARLPILLDGTRLTVAFVLAALAVVVAWWVVARSSFGFQLQVAGLAPRAARYAGFSERRVLWSTLLICGALAGIAGGAEAAGPIGQLTPAVSPGYGFAAIIVAFVGRLHPLGVGVAGVAMALLYIGGELAQSRLGLPSSLTGVMQGVLLFCLLACDALVVYRPRWQSAPAPQPVADAAT
jgi:simple sugar transport system permease protein